MSLQVRVRSATWEAPGIVSFELRALDGGEVGEVLGVRGQDARGGRLEAVGRLGDVVTIELERFFRDYKVLEAKETEIDELYDQKVALEVMSRALQSYRASSGWRKP